MTVAINIFTFVWEKIMQSEAESEWKLLCQFIHLLMNIYGDCLQPCFMTAQVFTINSELSQANHNKNTQFSIF